MTKSHAVRTFASIGVDIGKDVFHIVGFSLDGKIALRKKIKRLALEQEFQKLAPALLGWRHASAPTSSAVCCAGSATSLGSSPRSM